MPPDGLERIEIAEPDGSVTSVVVLGMVEDERGALAVTCPAAALSGDPDAPMVLRVLQVREKKGRLLLRDEPDPERAAWAAAVAEEALLDA
ncbi:MAG: hypothetical protein VX000_17485 [Myxococcota bacterium]|nr:hypothetical protein [Myxococcota bacterium]